MSQVRFYFDSALRTKGEKTERIAKKNNKFFDIWTIAVAGRMIHTKGCTWCLAVKGHKRADEE